MNRFCLFLMFPHGAIHGRFLGQQQSKVKSYKDVHRFNRRLSVPCGFQRACLPPLPHPMRNNLMCKVRHRILFSRDSVCMNGPSSLKVSTAQCIFPPPPLISHPLLKESIIIDKHKGSDRQNHIYLLPFFTIPYHHLFDERIGQPWGGERETSPSSSRPSACSACRPQKQRRQGRSGRGRRASSPCRCGRSSSPR
jgi:hypothetical protein